MDRPVINQLAFEIAARQLDAALTRRFGIEYLTRKTEQLLGDWRVAHGQPRYDRRR